MTKAWHKFHRIPMEQTNRQSNTMLETFSVYTFRKSRAGPGGGGGGGGGGDDESEDCPAELDECLVRCLLGSKR